jgi:YebC/PmpR family DNA-binding regulatory protein
MAGHSKWSNIRHKKAVQDNKRGKIFTKLIREITIASRLGGCDKNLNPRLRMAITIAASNNMSKDTINRAINKGQGNESSEAFIEVSYEGYGPAGTAFIIDCMTDNKNRTVSEVRRVFNKAGAKLSTHGSVSYMFHKKGIISLEAGSDKDQVLETILDSGAVDIIFHRDTSIDVVTDPSSLIEVKKFLDLKEIRISSARTVLDASTKVVVNSKESSKQITDMIDTLESLDDVQNVYTNASCIDENMVRL